MDVLGARAVFGAPSPGGSGYVETAELIGGIWQATITTFAPMPQTGEEFGDSVALAGQLLAVGSRRRDAGGLFDAGRVSIFSWNGSTWVHETDLTQPGGPEDDARFGDAVDLWHDPATGEYRLIVGAPGALVTSFGGSVASGRAFILESGGDPTQWTPRATLDTQSADFPVIPADGDDFGVAVAIEANLAVIGAPFQDGNDAIGDNSGRAYVAERESTPEIAWTIDSDQILWEDVTVGRQLGISVAVRDGRVAVGAPGDVIVSEGGSEGTVFGGSVRVAAQIDGVWTQIQRLQPPDEPLSEGLAFGSSVALASTGLVVGVPANGTGVDPSVAAALWAFVDSGHDGFLEVRRFSGPADLGTSIAADRTSGDLVRFASSGLSLSEAYVRDVAELISDPDCPVTDCNDNGFPDRCDIAIGLEDDCDQSGLPDRCELTEFTDCNENELLDSCELITAEIVWILDGSLSTDTKGQIICEDLIVGVEADLAANGILTRSTILGVTAGCTNAPCIAPGQTVEELYGTAVPLPDNGTDYSAVSVLASNTCESWAAATAIVVHSHPWQGALRIVIPIADECAWDGGDVPADCDGLDDLSVEAAGLFADCRDVFVLPIQTPGLGGQPFAPVADQMAEIASLTSGVWFQSDLTPSSVDALRTALEVAIRTRTLVHDFAPYVPDGSGGAIFGDGVLDTCEIQADPAAFDDCNGNGIDDTLEILLGDPTWAIGDPADLGLVTSSVDLDGNGILDLCEAACCPGDLDRDGFVDFDDLLIVLNDLDPADPCTNGDPYADFCDLASFPPSPCPGDVDGDGDTDFQDILGILNTFDACFVQGAPPCAVIRRSMIAPPQSVLDCLQRANWDPVKAAACIDALNLVGAQP